MGTYSHTEEEFKKVLKTLFAEKKRVKELQKRLDGKGLYQKFQNRITETQELTALKQAYAESEKANSELRAKLDRLRPAVKKLVEELKALQNREPVSNDDEIAQIKAEAQEESARLSAEFEVKLEVAYHQMREMAKRNANRLDSGEGKQQLEKELAGAYTSLESAKRLCEEYEAEVRQAQQHMAKKIKEAAILRDQSDRQARQIAELQEALARQQQELEQAKSKLQLQQMHDEKHFVVAREWQEELEQLRKVRDNYDQMAATVESLKSILGKREEN